MSVLVVLALPWLYPGLLRSCAALDWRSPALLAVGARCLARLSLALPCLGLAVCFGVLYVALLRLDVPCSALLRLLCFALGLP